MIYKATTTRPRHAGFTLIEMLVVIGIIAIVMGLSFPMIAAMQRDSSASSGVNTISLAVAAAKRYASDPQNKFVQADINPTLGSSSSEPGLYSGVIALFTPAGEIRLCKNDEYAQWGRNWFLERHGPVVNNVSQAPGLPARELNGFKDMALDYVQLGSDVAVAAITRNRTINANDPPLVIPPPFALWFDQNGYMVVTGQDPTTNQDNDYQFVYYDGNYDDNYDCKAPRPNKEYNPNAFNPNHADFERANYNDNDGKYVVPFEKIEAVIGVFVYSHADFHSAVNDGTIKQWEDAERQNNRDYWDWMKENAQLVLFSRQTGMMMRSRNE